MHDNGKQDEENRPELETKLTQQLAIVDRSVRDTAPSLEDLEGLVRAVQAEKRQRLWRDLCMFWLIALLIIALMLWSYARFFEAVLILQAAATVAAGAAIGFLWRRRRLQRRMVRHE
ncbi:YxlC family protein [Paenibacillus beijingensis]|uniref:Uncharacterized protein n=1 Tax=Paenibacillus beijingensis TaxID=1126833 RepID=A0A0D5NFE9_9BACL|nr:YxlC family protein [Paenibacillus beijingensis]AJY73623.1 hypothetical protein VN24_02000 [Paenibacillus beijingensis]